MYAIVNSRPDLVFSTSKLAQFMSDPAKYYKSAVKHLLQYIRSTKNRCIHYGLTNPDLLSYSDANYTSNKSDRKLISRNIFLLASRAVS
jgi:hypothetical protein